MEYTVFLNRIKNNMIEGPYAFVGEELYLADNTIESLKNKYMPKNLESMNYRLIDASKSSINDIMESCYQLPLMSEKRLTVVKDLSDNQIKELGSKMEELIDLGSTSIIIFLICPGDINKSTNFYKKLMKNDHIVSFDTVTEAQLKNWVKRKIDQAKLKIEEDALELFLLHINYTKDNSNNSLYFVDGELNKLYSIDKDMITVSDIEEITSKSPSSNIFKLTDAITNKNETEAILQLGRLFTTNEEPVKILYMISRHITNMSKVYKSLNMSDYEATKKIGISNFEYKKIKSGISRFNLDELKNGLDLIKNADIIIKSKKNDPKVLLESILIGFIRFIDVNNI